MNTRKTSLKATYNLLYSLEGLKTIDQAFRAYLTPKNPDLALQLQQAREGGCSNESGLILELAPLLEDFLGDLFQNADSIQELQSQNRQLSPLALCKKTFIRRQAQKVYTEDEINSFDVPTLKQALEKVMTGPFTELSFVTHVLRWLEKPDDHQEALQLALKYAAWAIHNLKGSPLFSLPQKTDPHTLISLEESPKGLHISPDQYRYRDGFSHTGERPSLEYSYDQAHYCIFCHHQGKDSCSKGLKNKKTNDYVTNPLGNTLTGCPLDQKISEMNELRAEGYVLGALGVICIDNPLVAGTGHRICNDCSKACIYQKQDPVDIPSIESQILKSVLELPFGFEIYSLLTRWNPLNFKNPLPKDPTGYSVLVAGLGPAGFTLSHYLLQEGHRVMAIDGLKIEPLEVPDTLIETVSDLYEPLQNRVMAGFGGVAEYGITVRWDKNNLKLLRLLLQRRSRFQLQGGVRLGSNVTPAQAFEKGFDHIALCLGAGSPKIIPLKNNLAKGVRKASDFLMALQLTGAAKKKTPANLQIRMPIVVIGGGLTAVDTATEAAAYYITQVENFADEYDPSKSYTLTDQEKELAEIFLAHAAQVRQEREQAQQENRPPFFQKLLNQWGGVTIAYRRGLQEAPCYRLNHEEVAKAFEEGISFLPHFTPQEVILNEHKESEGLKGFLKGEETVLPAGTILIAAGTKPNTILAEEEDGFYLDKDFFQLSEDDPSPANVLLKQSRYPDRFSLFGDLHPSFNGNVVKAMASAKRGYAVVTQALLKHTPKAPTIDDDTFFNTLKDELSATVVTVNQLAPKIVEVVVRSPLAAKNFQPGQFYRLQNYETKPDGSLQQSMEGLALTGASVDVVKGTISLIVLEMGGSSNLCRDRQEGEAVVLMGPTGTPTHIPENETVLLVGGGLGNAVLYSIGKAMREKSCRVIYAAAYREAESLFKQQEIEAAADYVIWCCEDGKIEPCRPQDRFFQGNIVQALEAYASGSLDIQDLDTSNTLFSATSPASVPSSNPHVTQVHCGSVGVTSSDMSSEKKVIRGVHRSFSEIDRVITIGSDRMMAALHHAFAHQLKPSCAPNLIKIASINSPMQCMMKEICAQCLQRHIDPNTGQETFVYSCHKQDQPLDCVDFPFLHKRLQQNSLWEKVRKRQ